MATGSSSTKSFHEFLFWPDPKIVSDVLQAKVDSLDIREGPRHHIDVMVKDSIKYANIGGWRFEEFKGDSPTVRLLTPQIMAFCTNCHKSQKDMVFSLYRK